MACTAAVAELWPRTINTGSMRMLPKAMCEELRQVGARRLVHSAFCGTSA